MSTLPAGLQPFKRRRKYTPAQAEDIRRRRLATIAQRYGTFMGGHHTPQIRMIVSPWFIDPVDGLQTRIVRAAP